MKSLTSLCLAVAVGLLWSGSPVAAAGYIEIEAIIPIGPGNEVVNELGEDGMIMDPDDLLYNKQLCPGEGVHEFDDLNPVFAPDGHHVTWGEYSQVQGLARLRCGPRGTHVVIQLSGLIPKGVYTIWVFVFEDGVMGPVGAGALGAPDGSQSAFRASASGRGTIAVHHPAGPLSALPHEVDCLLDEFSFHLVGAYHLDGEVYGPVPAPLPPPVGGCYWVPHFAFVFE